MEQLRALPSPARTALATATAERLFPAYEAVVRLAGRTDVDVARMALDAAWEAAAGNPPDREAASDLVERCVELIAEIADIPGSAYADDAIAAAAYALQSGAELDPKAAGWASQRVLDAIDTFLLATVVSRDDPHAELRVWESELMQLEIRRREEDRATLRTTTDVAEAVMTVRSRALASEALPGERLRVTLRDAD